MLNDYDEWFCDGCGDHADSSVAMVFTPSGEELCDDCYEKEVP